MDDPSAAPAVYRCPGQNYTIARDVHLARLASFYPACLDCAHRRDSAGLATLQLRQWADLERDAPSGPRLCGEGLEGATRENLDTAVVARAATSLAAYLWRVGSTGTGTPTVLVGTDGSWTTAELVPAACRALAIGGCQAAEAGAVTSAGLAAAAFRTRADAALWIGNSSGEPHAMTIKLWREKGRPSSSPGDLDVVWSNLELPASRQKRGGGGLRRLDADEAYLSTLQGMFHGLRPLVFVLDTACRPLVRCWRRLSAGTACRMIQPGGELAYRQTAASDRSFVAARTDVVAREVLAAGAHFGIWIDGDGEACRLVDQRGCALDGLAVFALLARRVCRHQGAAAVVLEPSAGVDFQRSLERAGACVRRGPTTRQGMYDEMAATGAVMGGGSSGRYWYAGPPPAPDALASLCLLVSILSESDRPLSEVLDAPRAGG